MYCIKLYVSNDTTGSVFINLLKSFSNTSFYNEYTYTYFKNNISICVHVPVLY